MNQEKKGNPIALLPIGVFLVMYLGLGLLFEYWLKIPMGFYNIPIVVAFLVAILVACLQNRSLSFDEKLTIMGQGVGDKNIITMLLIFLVAGAFVGVVGRSSAQSVAYFMLDLIPPRFAVVVLFLVACFVSTAMGTSVGTITLLTPIAVEVAPPTTVPTQRGTAKLEAWATSTAMGVSRVMVPTLVPMAVDTKQATRNRTTTAYRAGIRSSMK